MTPSTFLINAKSLIDTPDKWLQGSNACDMHGNYVPPTSATACKFCSLGALAHFLTSSTLVASIDAHTAVRNVVGSIVLYNDFSTHDEVMAAWDIAICSLQASGL